MMLAYRRFLQNADELQRRIQLEALALGFGAALVGAAAYRLLERAGAIGGTGASNLIMIMAVAYSVGVPIADLFGLSIETVFRPNGKEHA